MATKAGKQKSRYEINFTKTLKINWETDAELSKRTLTSVSRGVTIIISTQDQN